VVLAGEATDDGRTPWPNHDERSHGEPPSEVNDLYVDALVDLSEAAPIFRAIEQAREDPKRDGGEGAGDRRWYAEDQHVVAERLIERHTADLADVDLATRTRPANAPRL
jgi:hypothetical protein